MTISIITDSLSMPRVVDGECTYIHQTWPKLLQKKVRQNEITIAEFSARARDTDSLNEIELFNEAIKFSNPSVVILQIGIVDCAPRIISKNEHSLLNRYFFPKKVRDAIIKFRKNRKNKILSRGALKKVYVNPNKFYQNFSSFINKLQNFNSTVKIIIIPIIGYTPYLEKTSNGYSNNINTYNEILFKISKEHNLYIVHDLIHKMSDKDFYTSDGYHLNQKGQLFLSEEISALIGNYII